MGNADEARLLRQCDTACTTWLSWWSVIVFVTGQCMYCYCYALKQRDTEGKSRMRRAGGSVLSPRGVCTLEG